MGKFKTILKYIFKMDYKNMFKIVYKVSKKSKKNIIYIFFDVLASGIIYGAGYYDYQEFEFYLLTKKSRKTYLTRAKNNQIIKRYNNQDSFYKFDDKGIFNEIFNDYLKREYILINENNFNAFKQFTINNKELIVKPIDGVGGVGVEKIIIGKSTDLIKLFNKLIKNKQYLVEECIKQHPKISKLYKDSVNTLRLFTFYDGKESHVLNSVFKIGNGGVTDNFSSGSMYTFTDDKGKIIVPAIDQEDNIYSIHPITKEKLVGFTVPLYFDACDLAKKASKVVPDVKYIGWDIAITSDGPVIIEGNSYPGVFQIKPSLSNKKEGLIPKYAKIMKID
ncbi:MAG: sugar-transfer associated ATP-grasp domain-containing protein [Bacilli bacterium]|nr:sugar-transfer associated ATP-grasp domain-containing protein [Bacilli bacterium]MDD4795339.1 sugar-transfer associated ATP-grasp domain-containing protein [Bacilli bacterium]